MVEKELGTLSQALLKNFLKEVFKNFKNFKQGEFGLLAFCCSDSDVAVYALRVPAAPEQNPVERDFDDYRLSPATG